VVERVPCLGEGGREDGNQTLPVSISMFEAAATTRGGTDSPRFLKAEGEKKEDLAANTLFATATRGIQGLL